MTIINKVQLSGNLGSNPEVKTFENGSKLLRFSLATNESYTTQKGESVTDTQWHFITVWGKLAEELDGSIKKGSLITLDGRLVTRNYVDKNGTKKYITEVVAKEIEVKSKP